MSAEQVRRTFLIPGLLFGLNRDVDVRGPESAEHWQVSRSTLPPIRGLNRDVDVSGPESAELWQVSRSTLPPVRGLNRNVNVRGTTSR